MKNEPMTLNGQKSEYAPPINKSASRNMNSNVSKSNSDARNMGLNQSYNGNMQLKLGQQASTFNSI
jgi:hypothetical protein